MYLHALRIITSPAVSPKPSILLLAYKFPPYREVGAQRWTLLTRYLAQLGHRMDVLTVDWDAALYPQPTHEEPWPEQVTIHRLRSGYPHNWVRRARATRLGRIVRNRTAMALNQLFYWDDEAQHWDRHVIGYARDLMQRQPIDVVIATGSPFQSMRWAAQISRQTATPLVLDFRDPWFYEPARHLSTRNRRGRAIKQWEQQTIDQAAAVVCVTRGMCEEFKSAYPQATRFETIFNGFDPQAVARDTMPHSEPNATFTYIGSINTGREQPADAFLQAVARHNYQAAERVTVRFVGNINPRMAPPWQAYVDAGWLTIVPRVSQVQALAYVRQSRYALYFGTADLPYALSTKIYEYGAVRVPTFAVHYGGEIEWLMREFSLGHSVNMRTQSLDTELTKALSGAASFTCSVEPFAYPQLAAQYSALIGSL